MINGGDPFGVLRVWFDTLKDVSYLSYLKDVS